jgi:hypothetical protein
MLKKIVVAASAAAVVLGAGTAALATSGTSASPAPSATGTSTAPDNTAPGKAAPGSAARGRGHRPALRALRGALHAQWVTRDGSSTTGFITHEAIRGLVTAVSASSITVKAADGVTQSYAVTSATKVRLREVGPAAGENQAGNDHANAGGHGKAGTITDVHTGDKVAVTGTGTGTGSLTAMHIIDRIK